MRKLNVRFWTLTAVSLVLFGCAGSGDGNAPAAGDTEVTANAEGVDGVGEAGEGGDESVIRLLTHESFLLPAGAFDNFSNDTGARVELIMGGDTGQVVAEALLTKGQPSADVLFGVDNTFLQRTLDEDLFIPYRSAHLDQVSQDLVLDPQHRVTPIDYGDVCINYWKDSFGDNPPDGLAALTDPQYGKSFITQNPETSSPGLAFLLATIATFGPDGWHDFWQQLTDAGVTVTAGWVEAYGQFVEQGGSVTSYSTSPVAEFVFASSEISEPPTAVLADGCFRQVEFAGILKGSKQPELAERLIDYLLSSEIQSEIPLNMFMWPANSNAQVPEVFERWATEVPEPLMISPAEIEANRDRWTQEWAEIVLR